MATIRKRVWKIGGVERSAWIVDYRDQGGVRRLKTFNTKREAEAWSVTALHEVRQGTHSPHSTSITVSEAWELWLRHCEANLERSTVEQRRYQLNLHVRPFIGSEKLATLTAPRIHQLVDQLREAGRSVAMRRKVLVNVGVMLGFCQGRGLVAQNVARGVKLGNEDREAQGPLREGVDFPTRAELKTLIDAASDHRRPFLITAVFAGMRASELRGLQWQDVDLAKGMIHVRRRADFWGTIGNTKSRMGKRDIPLPPIVTNALRSWRPVCPAGDLDLVFPNGAGKVQTQSNILSRFWDPLQVSCGLVGEDGTARYRFHALRHACASLFIKYLDWQPKRVQTVLGHASITMTFDRYGHLFADPESDREAMQRIESAITAA